MSKNFLKCQKAEKLIGPSAFLFHYISESHAAAAAVRITAKFRPEVQFRFLDK